MVFSSIAFLFYFLPTLLVVYYLVPKSLKNIVLLVASLIFYFFGEPVYVLLMIASILSSYIFGILIDKFRKYSKIFLILSVLTSVGAFVYFKYTDFLIRNINLFLTHKIDLINVILPIGISFYTFQMLSYVIDVYRNDAKVQKNIFKLALYVCLFPQLIAGPIVRYTTIEEQLENRTHTYSKFAEGIRRFLIGLGKKVLIANVLGELNSAFMSADEKSVLFYWLYGVATMLQIYFDFSGYSDMAIGLGKMFGFDFHENFNYPYIATSITDFWKRWHISLSSWFKDYIYIPLGGNRVSKPKWIRNIFVVWLLTGIWHGAEWNFMIWGLYFGIILLFEKILLSKHLEKLPKFITRIYVLFIVMISFIIFDGKGYLMIFDNIKGLFGIGNISLITSESIYYLRSFFVVLIVAIIGCTPIPKKIVSSQKINRFINIIEPVFLVLILVLSTSYIVDGSYNPFLYFRF